jgi:hypothetical protein
VWTVRLENERGLPLTKDFLIVERGSLPTGEAFPISSLIEAAPWYDTLLNPEQVEAFVAEIDAADSDRSKALASLRSLAQQATPPHVYLRFIGD